MSSEDARPASAADREQVRPSRPAPELRVPLSADEQAILDILEAANVPKTAGQLATASGLAPGDVTAALDGLRKRGLVTCFNTLIESYGARFPGIALR